MSKPYYSWIALFFAFGFVAATGCDEFGAELDNQAADDLLESLDHDQDVGDEVGDGSQPSGEELIGEAVVDVFARDANWQDTGFLVESGTRMVFLASGEVVHWQSRDRTQQETCGPDGVGGLADESVYLAPGLAKMALVGMIGNQVFDVGSRAEIIALATGQLHFGINDTNKFGGCADNEGFWTVEITVPGS